MLFLLPVMFAWSSFGFATETHGDRCRVVSVDHHVNPWEEGLDVFGDPQSDSDSQEVSFSYAGNKIQSVRLGQMRWSTPADTLKVKKLARTVDYLVKPEDSSYAVLLKIYPSERGVILYQEESSAAWQTVGTFDCSSVSEVEKAGLGSANVKALSSAQFAKLAKELKANLEKVDLAQELGDGYYDLKEMRYYRVISKTGDLAGFILWGDLYYTEDKEDVQALVRFDRNGLRLGEIETSRE